MYMFGSGVMTVTPQSNGSIAGQTPINIGLLQKGTITAKSTTKTLFGQYRDPLAVGAGTRTWSGKAEVARFSARVLSAIYFGGTPASGSTQTAYESHTVPATGPFTVTTTNSANYTTDLGVVYAATGLPLTEVASVTAIGQYSVSAGVYTFDSADASASVIIAYNWTSSSTGQKIVVPQSLIGPSFPFALNFTGVDPTTGNQFTGYFPNCIASNFSFNTGLEDFAMPSFEWEMFTNAAGSIGTFNFPDLY